MARELIEGLISEVRCALATSTGNLRPQQGLVYLAGARDVEFGGGGGGG